MCLKILGAAYVGDFYTIKVALRLAKNFKIISLKHKRGSLHRAMILTASRLRSQ